MNTYDQYKRTPLMHASHRGNLQLMQLLLDTGCDLHACDFQQRTALFYVTHGGHNSALQFLIQSGAEVSSTVETISEALISIFIRKQKQSPALVAWPLSLASIAECHAHGFHIESKTWKMGKDFPVREFWTHWKSHGILNKILENSGIFIPFYLSIFL